VLDRKSTYLSILLTRTFVQSCSKIMVMYVTLRSLTHYTCWQISNTIWFLTDSIQQENLVLCNKCSTALPCHCTAHWILIKPFINYTETFDSEPKLMQSLRYLIIYQNIILAYKFTEAEGIYRKYCDGFPPSLKHKFNSNDHICRHMTKGFLECDWQAHFQTHYNK